MNARTRRRVDTGFRSLRDLLACGLGVYGFLHQIGLPQPDYKVLGVCVVLMAGPGLMAVYRVGNTLLNGNDKKEAP